MDRIPAGGKRSVRPLPDAPGRQPLAADPAAVALQALFDRLGSSAGPPLTPAKRSQAWTTRPGSGAGSAGVGSRFASGSSLARTARPGDGYAVWCVLVWFLAARLMLHFSALRPIGQPADRDVSRRLRGPCDDARPGGCHARLPGTCVATHGTPSAMSWIPAELSANRHPASAKVGHRRCRKPPSPWRR
jgi:hypothetical protein